MFSHCHNYKLFATLARLEFETVEVTDTESFTANQTV